MPLRLNVGVTRKLGLPACSSIGASCSLDLEVDSGLLRDLPGFHAQARDAFVSARRAVDDELDRLRPAPPPPIDPGAEGRRAGRDGQPDRPGPPGRPPADGRPGKAATPNQVRAILSIARRQRADLDGLLCDLDVARPEELTLAQASRLIDQLKAVGPD